jgi:hypothetical protein
LPNPNDKFLEKRYKGIESFAMRTIKKRQLSHGVSDCKFLLKALNYYAIGLEDPKIGPIMQREYKIEDINIEIDNIMRMIGRIISSYPEFQGFSMPSDNSQQSDQGEQRR